MTEPTRTAPSRPTGPATLIVSPFASRIRDPHRRANVVRHAVAALSSRGHGEVVVVEAGLPSAVRGAAAQAVERGSGVVAVAGGDGTIRDAVGALTGTGTTVGIVPCGTGNLYATSIGVPRDIKRAIEGLTTATARPFDIGQVRLAGDGPADAVPNLAPDVFTVACGTGFDARLIEATTQEMKRRYGVAAYFLGGARLIEHLRAQPTVLTVDGVRSEIEAVVVLIANCGAAIPGRLRPRLPLDPQDGLLHVFILPKGGVVGGIRGVLELMTAASIGRSSSGSAIRLTGSHVQVEVTPAQPTQIDGDLYPTGSLEAWIQPGALSVLVP